MTTTSTTDAYIKLCSVVSGFSIAAARAKEMLVLHYFRSASLEGGHQQKYMNERFGELFRTHVAPHLEACNLPSNCVTGIRQIFGAFQTRLDVLLYDYCQLNAQKRNPFINLSEEWLKLCATADETLLNHVTMAEQWMRERLKERQRKILKMLAFTLGNLENKPGRFKVDALSGWESNSASDWEDESLLVEVSELLRAADWALEWSSSEGRTMLTFVSRQLIESELMEWAVESIGNDQTSFDKDVDFELGDVHQYWRWPEVMSSLYNNLQRRGWILRYASDTRGLSFLKVTA